MMIFLVFIIGLVLRLISLNQSLWIDEATTMNVARNFSFTDIITKFAPGDFHPPLYYIFMKLWVSVFGTSEIAGRVPSVIFGVATIYVIYLIGKKIFNREVGFTAALLLSTSGLHIYYSQEARMYSLTALLVSLAVFSFVRVAKLQRNPPKEEDRVGNWIVFAILIALIGAVDYIALLILPVFWLSGIICKQSLFLRGKKDLSWFKRLFMSHIILIVFGLLWLPIFSRQFNSGLSVSPASAWAAALGTFSVKEILLMPVKFMIGRVSILDKKVYFLVISATIAIFGYLVFRSKSQFEKLKLVWLWLLVPVGLGILISIKIPVLNYFRFLFVLPAFYLIIACGVNTLQGKWKKIFLVLILGVNVVSSLIYLTDMKFQREDWRGMVRSLNAGNQSLVFPAKSQREAVVYYGAENRIVEPENLRKGGGEIWLVRYAQPISDPNDLTGKEVEDLGYKKQQEMDFNGVVVWRYALN